MPARLISFVGAPGAGKTSIATAYSKRFGATMLGEQPEQNPFLSDSYTKIESLALASQLAFLLSRIEATCAATWPEAGLFVADWSVVLDHAYARVLLNEADFLAYDGVYQRVHATLHLPDVIVLLRTDPRTLIGRIASRSREWEGGISEAFIRDVCLSLDDALSATSQKWVIVNTDTTDLRAPADVGNWAISIDCLALRA